MVESKIRFAVVGCGVISGAHLEGIAQTKEAELVAVQDVIKQRAKESAAKYGVRSYESFEELLKQDDIDVICICTPSGLHPEQTIMAAQAGKHVICEKPMAIKREDITMMVEASKENGVLLATIFPRRMSPSSQYVKKLLQEGRLGKLSLCSAFVKFYRNQAYYDGAGWRGTWEMDGGGAMMNQGIHSVDLLQWLVGPVDSLYGRSGAVLRNIEVEDTATALLQFKSGAMGVIEATTTAYNHPSHQIVIHGDKGTVVLTEDKITSLAIVEEELQIPKFEPFQLFPDGHQIQIRDMALAVKENRQPSVPGTEGMHSLEIILGTYESSRTRKEVQL